MISTDVLIIGAGPAGLALASECSQRNLNVTVLDPNLDKAWPNQYAAWVDELAPMNLAHVFDQTWPGALVWVNSDAPVVLDRPYGVIDNGRLRATLTKHCSDVTWISAEASAYDTRKHETTVVTTCEQTLTARLVVDAAGGNSALPRFGWKAPTAFQTAHGILATVSGCPPTDLVTLMDFREPAPDAPKTHSGTPSFLYSMPRNDGRWFFEETVLVAEPAVPVELLEKRLHSRLAHQGITVEHIDHIEHCVIPMNVVVTDRPSHPIRYGVCGGFVHPATGYSVVESLSRAPHVAEAIAEGLTHYSSNTLPAHVWSAIWTEDQKRCQALYQFGANALAQFDTAQTQAFMSAFFSLPESLWSGYLSRQLTSKEVCSAMARVFGRFPTSVQKKLAFLALKQPKWLVRGVFGG